MPRQAHPMKEPVILWLAKQHDKKPFEGVISAMDAARQHFSGEELPATLRQWATEAIGYEPKKRNVRRGKRFEAPEVFTFESALQQIEQIKSKMIHGLKNQYKMILQQEKALEQLKLKLDNDIDQCAKMTGSSKQEISAQLETVQG